MLKKIGDYFTRLRRIESSLASFQKQCIDRVSAMEELVRVTEERSRSIEDRANERFAAIQAPICAIEQLVRVTEERSRSIEDRANERFAAIQAPLSAMEELVRVTEARSRSIEHRANEGFAAIQAPVSTMEELVRVTEERSRSIEHRANEGFAAIQAPVSAMEELVRVTEERSRSIEYQVNENLAAAKFQIDLVLKHKIDDYSFGSAVQLQKKDISSGENIRIRTEYPLAIQSNDHINPQSTMEGLVRPTKFVMHCIDKLGDDIRVMDVGVGAAGLVFEFLANGIFAVGVDGSDYCRKHKIGYWPLIGDSLFNSDITKPFGFFDTKCDEPVLFDLITSWECLEHIDEGDLPAVFKNVINNLADDGYFIGSISTLPYADDKGQPYHLTLKPKDWWKRIFIASGLEMCDEHKFTEEFFYRGNGPSFQDRHNYLRSPSEGFHFVAKKMAERL